MEEISEEILGDFMKALNLLNLTGALIGLQMGLGTQAYSQTYVIIEEGGAQSEQVTPKIVFTGDAADELYNRMSKIKVQKVKIETNDYNTYFNIIPELINANGAGEYSVKYGVHMTCAKFSGSGEEENKPELSKREQKRADKAEKNKTEAQKKREAAAAKKKEDYKKACWVILNENATLAKPYKIPANEKDKTEPSNPNKDRDLGTNELTFSKDGKIAKIRITDESKLKSHRLAVEIATQINNSTDFISPDTNELSPMDGQTTETEGEDNRASRRYFIASDSHLFGIELIDETIIGRDGVARKGYKMAGLNINIEKGEARIARKVIANNEQ
jgi:hypothetical protein